MEKNELDIRVLATIRTDLALKKRALEAIARECPEEYDYEVEEALACADKDLDCAIGDLNTVIDRLNQLSKEQ